MRVLFAASPLVAAMSTAALADISDEHRKAFSLVADAITSAKTCNEIGYIVDFDGIVEYRHLVQDAAVADGHELAEARAEIDQRIELKYRLLRRRFNADQLNARSYAKRGRYHRYWSKKCSELADSQAIKGLFVEPES